MLTAQFLQMVLIFLVFDVKRIFGEREREREREREENEFHLLK